MSSDKLQVALVFEVIGKPAEHLTTTLNEIIDKIDQLKGIKVIDSKVHDPAPFRDKESFFTNFAEIEIQADNLIALSELMFIYIPSHVEIISPERLNLQNNDVNDLFNGLTNKLHGYDEVTRVLQTEKIILVQKLKELTKNSEKKD